MKNITGYIERSDALRSEQIDTLRIKLEPSSIDMELTRAHMYRIISALKDRIE